MKYFAQVFPVCHVRLARDGRENLHLTTVKPIQSSTLPFDVLGERETDDGQTGGEKARRGRSHAALSLPPLRSHPARARGGKLSQFIDGGACEMNCHRCRAAWLAGCLAKLTKLLAPGVGKPETS